MKNLLGQKAEATTLSDVIDKERAQLIANKLNLLIVSESEKSHDTRFLELVRNICKRQGEALSRPFDINQTDKELHTDRSQLLDPIVNEVWKLVGDGSFDSNYNNKSVVALCKKFGESKAIQDALKQLDLLEGMLKADVPAKEFAEIKRHLIYGIMNQVAFAKQGGQYTLLSKYLKGVAKIYSRNLGKEKLDNIEAQAVDIVRSEFKVGYELSGLKACCSGETKILDESKEQSKEALEKELKARIATLLNNPIVKFLVGKAKKEFVQKLVAEMRDWAKENKGVVEKAPQKLSDKLKSRLKSSKTSDVEELSQSQIADVVNQVIKSDLFPVLKGMIEKKKDVKKMKHEDKRANIIRKADDASPAKQGVFARGKVKIGGVRKRSDKNAKNDNVSGGVNRSSTVRKTNT